MRLARAQLKKIYSIVLSALIPANAALAEPCPTRDNIGQFRVLEKRIDYAQEFHAENDKKQLYAEFGIHFESASPDKAQKGRQSVSHQADPGLNESIFVNGIADFIEKRAKAELRLWFTDFLSERICANDGGADFFANTCALDIHTTQNVFGIERQYLALVLALRKDLEYLPACAIYRHTGGSGLGYMLKSVFEGYANNGKLDELLYGLADKFKTTRITEDSERIFVFSVLAYSSAIEVGKIWVKDRDAAAVNFLLRLNGRIDGISDAGARAEYEAYFRKIAGNYLQRRGELESRIDEFYQLRESVLQKTGEIKSAATREETAALFIKNAELIFDQLLVLLRFENMREDVRKLSRHGEFVRALYAGSQAIEVHEYGQAFLELKPVFDRILTESKNDELKKALETFNSYSGAIASLAEAKSADDFSSRLDALASPVGAWKLKNEADMLSFTALPGIRYSNDEYSSAGFSGIHEERIWSIGAPVGIQKTWHECRLAKGYCGLMFSILDVGNIIDAPRDIRTPAGNISGKVESDFSSVFTPGIYLTMSPHKDSPFNIAIGYSEGPSSGYRTLIADNGEEFPVERNRVVSVLLSIDVTFFTF